MRDNAWVERKIEAVLERFENGPNLLKPLYGQLHQQEVLWHRKQLLEVVGGLEHVVQNAKTFGLAALGLIVMLAALLFHQDSPWYADVSVTFTLGIAAYLAIATDRGYRLAFIQVHILEFRNFTNPTRPTAHLTTWLPRLMFYDRPEVWAGTDGHSGLLDSDAFILLCLPNRQPWQSLLNPRDFRYLPAFRPTFEGINPRLRRTRLRSLASNGSLVWLIKQLHKQRDEVKMWVWAAAGGGLVVVGLLLLIFAPTGTAGGPQG